MHTAEVTQNFLISFSSFSRELFLVVTLEQEKAKRLTIEGFFRFPPVFQKEFSDDMHGVKQTQMKFIIVKFTFQKAVFPACSFPAGVFLCVIARLTWKKTQCNHFWLKKARVKKIVFIKKIERTSPRRKKQLALCNRGLRKICLTETCYKILQMIFTNIYVNIWTHR